MSRRRARRTFKERLAGGGHTVCRLDGQGPEGVSEAAFVARVTGRSAGAGTDAAADALATCSAVSWW